MRENSVENWFKVDVEVLKKSWRGFGSATRRFGFEKILAQFWIGFLVQYYVRAPKCCAIQTNCGASFPGP